MITLTLLHPVQSTPVQSWSFEKDPVIQIGRAVDNHVVLYSAVVSRYHVELRQNGQQWEVVNLGTNGTYLDGARVHQAPLIDGSIIRLARSGPNIQVRLGESADVNKLNAQTPEDLAQDGGETPLQTIDSLPMVDLSAQDLSDSKATKLSSFQVTGQHVWPPRPQSDPSSVNCQHERAEPGALVCIDCGRPINPLYTVGDYSILKPLGTRDQTFVAWRNGHVVVLKMLNQTMVSDPNRLQLLREQAKFLCQISHPGMPKIYEAFEWQGQIFLVSEMIYGQTLKQLVETQGPIPQKQVASWAVDICHVLGHLHQQTPPILHQGLKPSNLVRPTIPHGLSQVVLVNFGELSAVSEAGTAIGSVAYAAPEQQTGKPTPASDLYSLGATMVYLLTEQEPDAFYRLGNQEVHLSVDDIPDLSSEMAQVIGCLTHPNSAERYESPLKAAEALQVLA